MRKIDLRAAAGLAALAVTLFSAAPGRAQMVPRLVDYPVYNAACVTDPHTGLAQQRTADGRIQVFSLQGCPANALLYTVAVGRAADGSAKTSVTPTGLGVSFLAESCSQYSWAAGAAQDVSASGCGNLVARP
jgi:hypothetical protein